MLGDKHRSDLNWPASKDETGNAPESSATDVTPDGLISLNSVSSVCPVSRALLSLGVSSDQVLPSDLPR